MAACEFERGDGGEALRLTALRNDLWDRVTAEVAGASVNGSRGLVIARQSERCLDRIESDSLIVAMRCFSLSSDPRAAPAIADRRPQTAIVLSPRPSADPFWPRKSNTAEQMDMLIGDPPIANFFEKPSGLMTTIPAEVGRILLVDHSRGAVPGDDPAPPRGCRQHCAGGNGRIAESARGAAADHVRI
jgi:hypothetical protein